MSWMEEGCFLGEKKALQGCKSNQNFYRNENRKWPILQGWKPLLTQKIIRRFRPLKYKEGLVLEFEKNEDKHSANSKPGHLYLYLY